MNRRDFEAEMRKLPPEAADRLRRQYATTDQKVRKALFGRYPGAALRQLRADRGVGRPVREPTEILLEGPVFHE